MFDAHSDLVRFHDSEVTLSQQNRTEMRDHRDANRTRLTSRFESNTGIKGPTFTKQGSYAMLTMVQDDENDYDIDDGVYFPQASLVTEEGDPIGPRRLRELVKESLEDDRFNTQPRVKKTCVRIFYNEGYHVDMPCYRIRTSDGEFELATEDSWAVSRAADVEQWFKDFNESASPDTGNGRQFRRIVRLLKKFSRSRKEWKSRIAPGFTITALAREKYVGVPNRDDQAFRETAKKISDRLALTQTVKHPVTPNAFLSKGSPDPEITFLQEKLAWAADELAGLDAPDCDIGQARKIWGRVFNTGFFKELPGGANGDSGGSSGRAADPVRKDGPRNYA